MNQIILPYANGKFRQVVTVEPVNDRFDLKFVEQDRKDGVWETTNVLNIERDYLIFAPGELTKFIVFLISIDNTI